MIEPLLRVRGLGKSFEVGSAHVDALCGVDLEVATGEYLLLHGASGAGKSTLLLVLGGMLHPSTGQVWLAGTDLYGLGAAERRALRGRSVGFAFQSMHLLPYLDCISNVALGRVGVARAEQRSLAREQLEALGLADRLGHRPAQLSVGERQRVALARALVSRPALLLADEPTGNLDSASAALVEQQIGAFHGQGGTVLLATHDRQVGAAAGRSLLLQAGALSA